MSLQNVPSLCFPASPTAHSTSIEVCGRQPEIARNHAIPFYCTSNMCCHYLSFWSSHDSIASEDNRAYYFQWAPSRGFNGPAITRTKTHWEAALLSCHQNDCEFVWSQRRLLLLFSPVGFERARKGSLERNKSDPSPSALCLGWVYIYEQLWFYRIDKFSKVKPVLSLISYL